MAKTAKKGGQASVAPKVTPPVEPTGSGATLWGVTGTGRPLGEMVRRSNLWRDNYNPLRLLTIQRLLTIFEFAERGAFAELQLVLRKAEKRYPVLKGFVERLLCSVEELGWDVKVLKTLPPGATPEMAEKQRAFLKQRYDLIVNLNEAIGQIALAEIRGYAILQKHRFKGGVNDGAVSELYWLEPWCWARDGYYGDFYYNEISRFGVGLGSCRGTLGEDNRIGSAALPREEFIIREVESPIYEIALIAFVNWLMGRKDWSSFVEIFGLPNGVVIMPPNIPQGQESKYEDAAQKVADGVSGALPNQSDIKFPTASLRGEIPFEKFCEAQNQDVVMAATSGLLSMLTAGPGASGGLNRGPNQEHQDIWVKIARMKGKRVNETLNKQFDLPELTAEFPGQPVCVYFNIPTEDEEDIGALADTVVKFEGVNLQTDVKEVSDRAGMKLTRVQSPQPTVPGQDPKNPGEQNPADPKLAAALRNRAPRPAAVPAGPTDEEVRQFAAAVGSDVAPVLQRLQAITEIQDDKLFEQKLKAFYAEYPQLKADVLKDPKADRALLPTIVRALLAGVKKQPVKATA